MTQYPKATEEANCLECGKAIYGRPDKKFCSQECKNHYHNNQVRYIRLYKNKIITELQSNYNILDNLLKLEITKIDICDIEGLGFKPSIVTGFNKTGSGKQEFRCFDIKYYQTPKRITGIQKLSMVKVRVPSRTLQK